MGKYTLWLLAIVTLQMAVNGCGGKGASPTLSSAAAAQPAARTAGLQEQPADGELPLLHRPATWQDTRGFTPYEDYRPDQILVRFSDELPPGAGAGSPGGQPGFNSASVLYQNVEHALFARSLANQYGLTVLTSQEAYVPGFNFCGYQLPAGTDAEALMQRILDENPAAVRYAEYNAVRRACYTPDDPYLDDQWHHTTINSFDAWDYYGSPEGVVIAILDTGIDTDHEDLAVAILDWWDTYDLDLVNADWKPEDNDPSWESGGHGTHVAGIAAAFGNNSTGVAGVAWNTWILPIQVLGGAQDNPEAVEQGLVLATLLGADVINMSFGGYFPSLTEKDACKYAHDYGVILVAAAGNENLEAQIHYPAGIPYVMAVGATKTDDYKTSYSNYGWWVDIAAPGGSSYGGSEDIYSTVIGGYGYMAGTSMASPIVAGAAALIKSIAPDYEIDEYRGWLEAGGDLLADQDEWSNPIIRRLNVYEGLIYPENELPTVTITSPDEGAPVRGLTDITLEATDDGGSVYSNLYIDGILLGTGSSTGSITYEVDFTDFYPGECNIIAEVIDADHQHAFDEITVIVTDPRTFSVPYYTTFDTTDDIDGWMQISHSGANVWYTADDGAGGQLLRLDHDADDVIWLITPNINPGSYSQAKIVFRGGWDHTQGDADAYIWLYPDEPSDLNKVRLLDLLPIAGFPGYYEQAVYFEPGEVFKAAFMVGGNTPPDGTYITIDDFYLTVPTNPPTVSITQPSELARVSGNISILLNATDDWAVVDTCAYVNSTMLGWDDTPPYQFTFNSDAYPNGVATITARAYDLDWYDYDGDGNPWDIDTATRSIIVQNERITSISPSSGYYTDEVIISGSDFNHCKPGAEKRVLFSGASSWIAATVLSWGDTLIRTTVPVGAVTGKVRVYLDESYAESPQSFTLTNPFATLHFIAPADSVMFEEDFGFHLPKQPGLTKVEVGIEGHQERTVTIPTYGSEIEVTGTMDISGLNTGVYELTASGYYGAYSQMADPLRFFILALPGDFNGNGIVDNGDAAYLQNYLAQYGAVGSTRWAFLPFLDATGDGVIDERDLAYVGYHFGETL